MNRWTRGAMAMGALFTLVSCGGGGGEQRMSALEAQVKQLKDTGGGGVDLGPIQERVTQIAAENKESVGKVEEMLEFLQREVTKMAADKAPAAGGASDGALWYDVDQLLGNAPAGVTTDGDKLTVSRRWLTYEVHALALSGKAPKVTENKKGGALTIKGIKPKSLVDQLGIKNNDEILNVDNQPVATIADLTKALRASKSDIALKISRRKKEMTIAYHLVD